MATPEPRHGTRRTISIVDDVNLLSPQARTSLPLPSSLRVASPEETGLQAEEEEEGLFKADAVNEEDPERDRAIRRRRRKRRREVTDKR